MHFLTFLPNIRHCFFFWLLHRTEMTFASYSIMNRAKRFLKVQVGSAFRWSRTRACVWNKHSHIPWRGTSKVPNSSHIAFTVQSNWSLLHYGKQQGQRSSPVATPNPGKKQTKVLTNANLINSLSPFKWVQVWIFWFVFPEIKRK